MQVQNICPLEALGGGNLYCETGSFSNYITIETETYFNFHVSICKKKRRLYFEISKLAWRKMVLEQKITLLAFEWQVQKIEQKKLDSILVYESCHCSVTWAWSETTKAVIVWKRELHLKSWGLENIFREERGPNFLKISLQIGENIKR